jgi:peptidoglycan/xylan/chitin deacetylase (PgdA/CDA1 family)
VTDGPRIALTFDVEHPDRPDHGEHAGEILDELKRLDIRATAFIQGRWAEANPALARRWADDGHLVGSHTFYHARMPLLTEAGFIEDVHEAERVINETVGVDPRPWLRFPFGAGADSEDVVGRLPGLGYRHIGWHVEVYEWEPGRTPEEVVDRVKSNPFFRVWTGRDPELRGPATLSGPRGAGRVPCPAVDDSPAGTPSRTLRIVGREAVWRYFACAMLCLLRSC